jgi:hypothetical protein
MNCKKGDMAILVRTAPHLSHRLGMVFTCLELYQGNKWMIDKWTAEGKQYCVFDEAIRPLRGFDPDAEKDDIEELRREEACA